MIVNEYNANGELDTRKQEFNQWVLAVDDGRVPARMKDGEDEPTWIEILEKFLINSSNSPIKQIVIETYLNFIESHGKLYVALSRVTDLDRLKILMKEDDIKELKNCTRNIVYKEAFNYLS
ncbi:ATP-dependent DNA helicase PIF1-like protein [Tanacetum coccineum]